MVKKTEMFEEDLNEFDDEINQEDFKARYFESLRLNPPDPIPSILDNPYFMRGFEMFKQHQAKFKVPKIKKKQKQTRHFGLGY